MSEPSQTERVCQWVASAREREYPDVVLQEAVKCLVDWTAVCIGAYERPEPRIVHDAMLAWGGAGQARLLWGGSVSTQAAALVNGTLSHALDFDDTHISSVVHASAPLWTALLAVGTARQVDERLLLKAFVTGFEVAARLGDGGVGLRLNDNGWHATPTLGRLAVAAGVAVVLSLDARQVSHALAIAATQAGGLTASFGTMAKPFHVGKTAADGILAAELSAAGFEGAKGIIDVDSAFIRTLLQDPAITLEMAPFEEQWEIERNSFKPYAACQLTHAAIDAARALRPRIEGRNISRMRAEVHPLAIKIANVRDPSTSTEGKFSLGYCIALGLQGHPVTTQDFSDAMLQDATLKGLASRVESVPSESVSRTSVRLHVEFEDGQTVRQDIEHAFGSIGNPMQWPELEAKFLAVAQPVIGNNTRELLQTLHTFGEPGSLARMFELTAQPKR
jgi:2-methylcitrate dehydratase PrpD